MHNKQHVQINNNILKLAVIILSIALITGISFIPVLQASVYAQQPPQPLQSQQLQQQQHFGIEQISDSAHSNHGEWQPASNHTVIA